MNKKILWWGRSDLNYSRNSICQNLLQDLGYEIINFSPHFSSLAHIEILFRGIKDIHLVWVPCFRHRDLMSAKKWALSNSVPLIFDPFISAWDKQVYERNKYLPDSNGALNLKHWESKLFNSADLLIADTKMHMNMFINEFQVNPNKILVLNVGADDRIFKPSLPIVLGPDIHILFYGSFISLHGASIIAEAAIKLSNHKNLFWTFLGSGPELNKIKKMTRSFPNIKFENNIEYHKLSWRIKKAHILLGIFSKSRKANNVIPNKVYQSLACGRLVITRSSDAYPPLRGGVNSGIFFVPPEDSNALKNTILQLLKAPDKIVTAGKNAQKTYENNFSAEKIKKQMLAVLKAARQR